MYTTLLVYAPWVGRIPLRNRKENMTIKRKTYVWLHWFCVFTLLVSVTSCIKEDLSECEKVYTFTVKAFDASGSELSSADVKDVRLFIFNGNYYFVESIDAQVGESVTVNAPDGGDIHVVCWGNLGCGLQQCSQLVPGEHKDNCRVDLLPDARALSYSISPGDLFRGEITVTRQEQNGQTSLPIYRETGSMAITVRNLQEFVGSTDEDFSIVVGETYSTIDFYGNHTNNKVAYRPTGSFVLNDHSNEYKVAAFNMIPEETGLYIDVYHGGQKIVTVSQDNSGTPILVEKGKQTNILIELRTSVSVNMMLADWGKEYLWKEF